MYKIIHKQDMQWDGEFINTYTIYKNELQIITKLSYTEALEFILDSNWIHFELWKNQQYI